MINYCYEAGDYPEMLRYARQLGSTLDNEPSNLIHGRAYLAWALIKNGKSSEAHKLLDETEKDVHGVSPVFQVTADYASALVSFEEGKDTRALEKFRSVYRALTPNHEPNIFYAITLLRNGQTAEAVEELQRLTRWPAANDNYVLIAIPGQETDWPVPAVRAHYWLGVAHEKQGDPEKALNEYRKFLEIWKDADFHSAEIDDAKASVARLERAARR